MRSKANLVRWLLCVLLLLGPVCTAAAGRIIYVDADATGTNDGSSWENAYIYLQEALADAETAAKPIEIRVAQGIYTPDRGSRQLLSDKKRDYFQLINEVAIKGGFAGFSEADPNARDVDLYKTILSGDLEGNDAYVNNPSDMGGDPTRADNSRHVVVGSNTDTTAILDGVTVTGGRSTMRGIESLFGGAGIIIYAGSPTLINCIFTCNSANQAGGGLFNLGDSNPTLIGCTFSKNKSSIGGGMYNYDNSSPTLINCIFHKNLSYSSGGGMRNVNSSPKLTNCTFSENSADYGGGISNLRSNIILSNCVFTKNHADNSGGGMYNYNSSHPILTNCTFFGNLAGQGNALAFDSERYYPSIIEITNCIFWDNQSEIWNNDKSTIIINYSNILGGWPSRGNIDVEPLFVDTVNNDYHLKSQAGRWDPVSESWVVDDITSPCIDAGDPNSPVAFEPYPNGGVINMGAYGGTAKASKSPSGIHVKYGGGTGEPDDPYLIYTAEQMNTIGAEPNDWGKHFKLMADIDLSAYTGNQFNIIGGNPPFIGIFDGNDHTISNFTYISTDKMCGGGLFGSVNDPNAEIKNLRLIDPNVVVEEGLSVGLLVAGLSQGIISNCHVENGHVAGLWSVGGLVGDISGDVQITREHVVWRGEGILRYCSTNGVYVSGDSQVGGLVGEHWRGTITDCYSTGTVTGSELVGGLVGENSDTVTDCFSAASVTGGGMVGGLVGYNSAGANGRIMHCCSSGSVSGDWAVGGLVGLNATSVSNCYSTGDVIGNEYIGGLVGSNSAHGWITLSYSTGLVTGDTNIGGLVGDNYKDDGYISGSFWDMETSSQTNSDGGTGKTTAEMKIAGTFLDAGWDFVGESENGTEDIWAICQGVDYPKLTWQFTVGDSDDDGDVDFGDYGLLALRWHKTDGSFWCGAGGMDLTNDGHVNIADLAEFAENWLAGIP